jgi:hypothetical protein
MGDGKDKATTQPQQAPAAEPQHQPEQQAPEPPNYASASEFREFQHSVETGFSRLFGMLRAPQQARADAPPPIDDVPDDELENAIAEGRGSSKSIRRAINAAVEKVRREEVAPLRSVGLGAIAKLTKHLATKEMKFYDRYKREIDAAINELPVDQRLDPDLLIAIHNTIAGRPENIERMIAEERERALRSSTEDGGVERPGARRGDADRTPAVPSVREFLGEAAADALEAANRSPDRYAQGLGYRDWSNLVEEHRKLGTPGGTA